MTRRSALRTLLMAAAAAILILSVIPAAYAAPDPGKDSGVRTSAAAELTVDNGIPVVYLNIDESDGNPTIDDMNQSPDHSVTCTGTIRMDAPDGFTYSDKPGLTIADMSEMGMTIRGRGNSTWARYPKKPYKIKLDKKTDLFGLGKNKHWVLIANYFDHTLVKDRITAWLGDEMGFEFTPRGFPVDVVMTGSEFGSHYLGSYYLSENVRVDDNRLEIDELTERDSSLPKISGGYLVQDSLQVRQGSPDRFITDRGVGWATHTPSFDTEADGHALTGVLADDGDASNEELFNDPDPVDPSDAESLGDAYENHAQQQYIRDYIQQVEDALFDGGTAYRDVMDLGSAAKYWLVNSFCLNRDAYSTSSTYIYKKRNDPKIYWGPLWDFDFAWYYEETWKGLDIRHVWLDPMFYDTEDGGFVKEVEKQWAEMKPALVELARDGGVLDGYYKETKASALADAAIWRSEDFSYKNEIGLLKKWINKRIAWMDENISSIENMVHRVQFVSGDEVFTNTFVEDGQRLIMPAGEPAKDGYIFLGWVDESGRPADPEAKVTDDLVYFADLIPESEAKKAEDIAFQKSSDIQKRLFFVTGYSIRYEVIPEDAQDKRIKWTSSDESFATVDDEGVVTYVDKGTGLRSVTITATLSSGKSRDFTLYLTDGELPVPESISPEKDHIEMKAGGQAALMIHTQPDPAFVSQYSYVSDDESVVKVDQETGVLTAVGPGQTRVHVQVRNGETVCSTYTTVTVEALCNNYDLKDAKISGLRSVSYTGSARKPNPVVELGGRTLVKGRDYKLTYSSNRNVGTAKVIISGMGAYKGSRTAAFRIIPKATKIKSIRPHGRGFRVRWVGRTVQVSGYQLRWSRRADMSSAKTKLIKSKKRTVCSRKGLGANVRYYVQVRSYKTVKGKRYWSAWSKISSVKTRAR